jgi:hypothetical protein
MAVGREMDMAVAKVLGWRVDGLCPDGEMRGISPLHLTMMGRGDESDFDIIPYYSTSDADALAALDAMMAKRKDLEPQVNMVRTRTRGDTWHCYLFRVSVLGCEAWGDASTRAEAICRALLALDAAKGENV